MKNILFKVKAKVNEESTFYDEEKKAFIESKIHEVRIISWFENKICDVVIPFKESRITLFESYVKFELLEVDECLKK